MKKQPINPEKEQVTQIVMVECFLCVRQMPQQRVPFINVKEAYPIQVIMNVLDQTAKFRSTFYPAYVCNFHYDQQMGLISGEGVTLK